MTNLFIAFYLGGYVSSLLNARSNGTLTTTGYFYLLLWPMYAIITIAELLNNNSDTIWAAVKTVVGKVVSVAKWFSGLFKT